MGLDVVASFTLKVINKKCKKIRTTKNCEMDLYDM